MRLLAIPFFVLFQILVSIALGGDGKQEHMFAFHAELSPMDQGARAFAHVINGEEKLFKMSPDVTHIDFEAFVPFRSDDGLSYGAAFVLDRRGILKLDQWTSAKIGTYIAASVDMKIVDYSRIDKPIKDGVIVLWSGLTAEHIEYLEKKLKLKVLNAPGQRPKKD